MTPERLAEIDVEIAGYCDCGLKAPYALGCPARLMRELLTALHEAQYERERYATWVNEVRDEDEKERDALQRRVEALRVALERWRPAFKGMPFPNDVEDALHDE